MPIAEIYSTEEVIFPRAYHSGILPNIPSTNPRRRNLKKREIKLIQFRQRGSMVNPLALTSQLEQQEMRNEEAVCRYPMGRRRTR